MKLLIDECWEYQLLAYPNPVVGAMVVKDGAMIGVGIHKEAGTPHAEVLAIKNSFYKLTSNEDILKLENSNDIHDFLYQNHNNIFEDCEIYSTLEPCNHYGKTPPCSKLLEIMNFKRVIVGANDFGQNSNGGNKLLKDSNIKVTENILNNDSIALLKPFSKWIENKPFVFFKYAQTLNGAITGGYISCQKSLELVHKLRDKIDLLVIGGDTVRIDRPTLDTRFIENGNNPDILIYSRQKNFDKSIPLFDVPNREVFIENNLDRIKEYKLVMFEGGDKFLNLIKDKIDALLVLNSTSLKNRNNMKIDLDLKLDNMYQNDKDIVMWFQKVTY
jgi:diaminohydroxyphosphoribosylaminopyrimidine deaminase/5-amino-6-(5-phosphoribosylamino)uracil reductase